MRVAIYTRVSTERQAEVNFNSCEAQAAKIQSFILSQEDMTLVGVYADPGVSGASLDRPGLQAMLQDIQQGKIDLVIAYKIDRLTRSPNDFYHLIELFEQYQVDFLSITERFDTSTPSGRLLRNIMLTFAQFERELTSERTRDKMLQRAQQGLWNGGLVPFGYAVKDKKLVIDEQEAAMIRKLYDVYLTSGSLATVYQQLKDQGARDRRGLPFSKSGIAYILRNPIYTGKCVYADQVYRGIHQPIISNEIFEAAQALHKQKHRIMRVYNEFPLAGLLRCHACHSAMTPCHTNKKHHGKRRHYYYYRCTKTFKRDWGSCTTRQVSATRLECFLVQHLERISHDKQYLESLLFKLNHKRPGDRAGLERAPASSLLSSTIFADTLKTFVQGISEKSGIDKAVWCQRFIASIAYAPEEIALTLYYHVTSPHAQPTNLASGRVGAAAGQPSVVPNAKSPTLRGASCRMAPRGGLEPPTWWLQGFLKFPPGLDYLFTVPPRTFGFAKCSRGGLGGGRLVSAPSPNALLRKAKLRGLGSGLPF